MRILTHFDPWKSKLCTCPPKLTFNPYTGCNHRCVYCYASSYIKDFFNCRPKKNLLRKLALDAKELKGELISMSNSSDPYPTIEKRFKLTRKCLEILSKADCKLQIITKSDLVIRDLDILKKMRCTVSFTITTLDEKIAKKLEPNAPLPENRIKAAIKLIGNEIPVSVRIDPIIPFLNDKPCKLIKELSEIGVKHITTSTLKIKRDSWQRFKLVFPKIAKKLEPLYFKRGERIGRAFYLPKNLRLKLMLKIKREVEKYGMKFGCCREGFPQLNSATCDGSWLIR